MLKPSMTARLAKLIEIRCICSMTSQFAIFLWLIFFLKPCRHHLCDNIKSFKPHRGLSHLWKSPLLGWGEKMMSMKSLHTVLFWLQESYTTWHSQCSWGEFLQIHTCTHAMLKNRTNVMYLTCMFSWNVLFWGGCSNITCETKVRNFCHKVFSDKYVTSSDISVNNLVREYFVNWFNIKNIKITMCECNLKLRNIWAPDKSN